MHTPSVPAPRSRAAVRGRAALDPECAGCPELGLYRALQRAGLEVQGGSGCDLEGERPFTAWPGRWAAVVGAGRILAGADGAVGEAAAAGARLLVLADRDGPEARRAAGLLATAGARALPLELGDLARVEEAVREATLAGGVAIVALSRCARLTRRRPPLAIAASRCNRCGACLSLGCPAISDVGGEAMVVDPAVCSGCGVCAPLCRGRAIHLPRPHASIQR